MTLLVLAFLAITILNKMVNDAKVLARRLQCQNHLAQIGLALLAYHKTNGHFPPAFVADARGKPLSSWRVLLLPMLEQSELYKSFHLDKPWNEPGNAKVSEFPLNIYHCPADREWTATTDYVAVQGAETAWPGEKGSKLSDFANPSKTILVVEVANSGIAWAEPRDIDVAQTAKGVNPKGGQGISSFHQGGACAVFADGHVDFLPDDLDPKSFAAMLKISPTR